MVAAVNINWPTEENEFFSEIFFRLAKQNPRHTFIFIYNKPYHPSVIFLNNITPVIISTMPANPLLWLLWYNYKMPALLKKYKAEVFISSCISLRTKIPQCMLISDPAFLQYPQFILKSHFNFYKKNIAKFLKKAKVIITLSQFSKKDIIEKYKIDNSKIDAINIAANEIFTAVNFDEREIIKDKYADGNEYFLFNGEITPKNNLLNLLKAFSFFKKRQKSNMQLLICGYLGWKHEAFLESLHTFKFKNEVKLLSNLSKDELPKVIASGYAIVYPVFFPGLDVTLINSMQSSVPVITSDISAMHETLADTALYINPNNYKDIAEKMMLIFKDEELRKQLIEKGNQRAQNYHLDKTVSLFWKSILKTTA